MYLTEDHFIFINEISDLWMWEMVIPLTSVILDKWDIKEESRRQTVFGIGSSLGGIGIGTGAIHKSGQRNRLVIPYVDENGIEHEPIFDVGGEIRHWAGALYFAIINVKKQNIPAEEQPKQKIAENTNMKESPLKILKLRLAKGEISKEEFEELRKIIEP